MLVALQQWMHQLQFFNFIKLKHICKSVPVQRAGISS